MPCATMFGLWRKSIAARPASACEWRSMKPGVTILPVASITRVAVAPVSKPTAAIRPSFTATSP